VAIIGVGGSKATPLVSGVGSVAPAESTRVGVGKGLSGRGFDPLPEMDVTGGVGGGDTATAPPCPSDGETRPQPIINRVNKKRYNVYLRIL
jgi:hypothetical protein